MWLSGKAGPIRLTDILLILFSVWCSISLIVVEGISASIEPVGVHFLETMGAYLLARCYIRSADDFYKMVAVLFKAIAVIFPFAVIESTLKWSLAHDLFASVMRSHPSFDMDPRWGLKRAQVVFEHPILFGVTTGGMFALVHVVLGYQKSLVQRLLKSGLVAATAFFSLSAGPLAALLFQAFLLMWNWALGKFTARWKILWGFFACIYLIVAVGSNQTVAAFFIGNFSFDKQSSYFRILIWNFGSQSVMNHPLFGVALGEWDRPEWMPPSIDMFWLIYAIRHGLAAGILLFLAFASACFALAFKQGLDNKQDAYRKAYLITMAGFFLVGWTVFFWNATYVLFLFLLGSGFWLLEVQAEKPRPARRASLAGAKPIAGQANARMSGPK
jgi:hypothetical protein